MSDSDIPALFAESVRFELTVQLPVQRFSRPSRSTTPATFHYFDAKIQQFFRLKYSFMYFIGIIIMIENHYIMFFLNQYI